MPSPETILMRRLYPDCFITSEVAERIGKSQSTVERWRKEGLLEPSRSHQAGSKTIWLYTQEDVEQGKELAQSITPGRKSNAPT